MLAGDSSVAFRVGVITSGTYAARPDVRTVLVWLVT